MTHVRPSGPAIFSRSPTATPAATSTTPSTSAPSTTQRFVCTEGGARKFWEVTQSGASLAIAWGRIGTAGQTQTKTFADAAAAAAALAKLVKEKHGKGYVDVDSVPVGVPIDAGSAAHVAVTGGPAVGSAGAPAGGVSALSLRTGSGKLWSDLDNDGKADALSGDQDLVGATWSEDVDVATLPPAQKAVVDRIVSLARGQLNDNDDAENQPNNIVRIGDPEPRVNIVVDAKGEVLGVSVSFFQRGGAFDDEAEDEDDERDTSFDTVAAAKAAGVDTGADVSWSTSEAMAFDAKGKELRDASGHHWEWTGW